MPCDAQCWSAIGSLGSAIAASGTVIVAYVLLSKLAKQLHLQSEQTKLVERQIGETHEWNRRKATQETLHDIATGTAQGLLRRMRLEFGCDGRPEPSPDYSKALASFTADKQRKFLATLLTLINIFETVAVGVRHGIIDEDIA